jgi:hypothetical protein
LAQKPPLLDRGERLHLPFAVDSVLEGQRVAGFKWDAVDGSAKTLAPTALAVRTVSGRAVRGAHRAPIRTRR